MHCIENIVKETANQSGNFQISYFKDHIAKNKSVIGIHYNNSNGLLIKLLKTMKKESANLPKEPELPIPIPNRNPSNESITLHIVPISYASI